MNERLIELYRACRPKEALVSQDQFQSADVLLGTEVEKFAESIIRECLSLCDFPDQGVKNDFQDGIAEGHIRVKENIIERFGVK